MKNENSETKIAVLEANMVNIAKDISDIKADIKNIIMQLNRQPSLEAEILSLKKEIQEDRISFKEELSVIKKSSNLWKWLAPILTAILTASVTFLVIQYLQNLK